MIKKPTYAYIYIYIDPYIPCYFNNTNFSK